MEKNTIPTIKLYTEYSAMSDSATFMRNQSDFFKLHYNKFGIIKQYEVDKQIVAIETKALSSIDRISGIKDDRVLTPFSGIHITNISYGSKVILNTIYTMREREDGRKLRYIMDASQIGWNAMNYLLKVLAYFAQRGLVPEVYIGNRLLLKTQLPPGIRVIVNDTIEVDSIGKLQRVLLQQVIMKSPFSGHIQIDDALNILTKIVNNEQRVIKEDETLPFSKLTINLGKVNFDLKFRNRLTIVLGNSGVGKTLISTVINGLRADSNQAELYNVEVFTPKHPLTKQTFGNLKLRGMDISKMVLIIDDEQTFRDSTLVEEVYKSGAQIVVFSGDYSQFVYGAENIAILSNLGNKLVLNYPCENKSDFFLTNRPAWSLRPESITVGVIESEPAYIEKRTESISKMSASDITRYFPLPEVHKPVDDDDDSDGSYNFDNEAIEAEVLDLFDKL